MDSVSEWPEVELMYSSVIHVRRNRIDGDTVWRDRRIALGLLLVGNEVCEVS